MYSARCRRQRGPARDVLEHLSSRRLRRREAERHHAEDAPARPHVTDRLLDREALDPLARALVLAGMSVPVGVQVSSNRPARVLPAAGAAAVGERVARRARAAPARPRRRGDVATRGSRRRAPSGSRRFRRGRSGQGRARRGALLVEHASKLPLPRRGRPRPEQPLALASARARAVTGDRPRSSACAADLEAPGYLQRHPPASRGDRELVAGSLMPRGARTRLASARSSLDDVEDRRRARSS